MAASHDTLVNPLLLPSIMKCESSHCAGCGAQIHDQYILRVAPDLEWHASCLRCGICQQFLDENSTCFVHQGRPICKDDYIRNFRTCAKCKDSFCKDDVVMRARRLIFHVDCFRCSTCNNSLATGDEFGLREDLLFCKSHFDQCQKVSDDKDPDSIVYQKNLSRQKHDKSFENVDTPPSSNEGQVTLNGPRSPSSSSPNSSSGTVITSTASAMVGSTFIKHTSRESSHSHRTGGKHSKESKTTRVRTVLNEKQLATLRQCYNMNPRPDALTKENLTEITGLSSRVIRVWFQNKRCKDKKRSVLMKQMAHQEKNGQRLQAIQGLQGVPMIAGSPIRHIGHGDPHLQMSAMDVRSYHQPPPTWKALSDFAMQNDLRLPLNGGGNDSGHEGTGAFQQLMHGFGDASGMGAMQMHHQQAPASQHHGHPGQEMGSLNGLYSDMAIDDSYPHGPNSVSSSMVPSDLSSPSGSMD